jgi:hypothetical protein
MLYLPAKSEGEHPVSRGWYEAPEHPDAALVRQFRAEGGAERLARQRDTVGRLLIKAVIVWLIPCFVLDCLFPGVAILVVPLAGLMVWPVTLLLVIRRAFAGELIWRERAIGRPEASASQRRPQFTLSRIMVAMALVAAACRVAVKLLPMWRQAFR